MEKRQQINPYNPKNKLINKNDIQNILKKYGIFQNINNLDLYQEAFIHESYSIPQIKKIMERDNVSIVSQPDGSPPLQPLSYERLEYLGDAVMELIISNYLYERFPTDNEDFLSKLRVSLVNRMAVSHYSRILGFSKFLMLSKTLDDKENGRMRESFLEDIFEAFIGAIFLDFNSEKNGFISSFRSGAGFQVAETFLINLLEDECTEIDFTELILDDGNYKGKMVKYFNKVHKTSISFKTIDSDKDINGIDKLITVYVYRDDSNKKIGEGQGADTKKAQHQAGKNILQGMGLLS